MNIIQLVFWLGGEALAKIETAAEQFWDKVQSYVDWTKSQADALTCAVEILELLAWQRDVERLENEPLDFFRVRVKYAYANAKDAGSVAGFKRIFARLGVNIIEMQERQDQTQVNWDLITILIEDKELQDNGPLITSIIDQYGRTCRRYELTTFDVSTVNIAVAEFGGSQDYTEVEYVPN